MLGIRSITFFLPEVYGDNDLKKILAASREWSKSYGLIRTQRIALFPGRKIESISKYIELSKACNSSEIRWFNVPLDPINAEKKEEVFRHAENVLTNCGRAFVNILAFQNGIADNKTMELSADLIRRASKISVNGKDNFRLGLSVNVNSNGPFFPFTMSSGSMGFSIALELTQEINIICKKYNKASLVALRKEMINELEKQIEVIEKIAMGIAEKYKLDYDGFDFSIAPIIDEEGSVITILRHLGVSKFGKTGIMFATSFLTDLVKGFQHKFKTVGFCGVMYSLLEDLELCLINNRKGISLEEMIELSTMCGCGVDMIPVPGDITDDELKSIFLEVYAISTRLNKPLGIRILPIPGGNGGQTQYTNLYDDADFIANTRVMKIDINSCLRIDEEFAYLNKYKMVID